MPGSQPGGKQSIFVGDMRAGFVRLARASISLTKKDSERAVTAKMRLSITVILCGVACGLAPTKVSRGVEDGKLWPD